jgi:hypothetical protein
LPIGDNQNSLKSGGRGPTVLEDFILREKITHFERIPERIVHARGSAAHGYFQPYKSMRHVTSAAFLADATVRTPVFARFSTVAGGSGSVWFYNQRAGAENLIKEANNDAGLAAHPSRRFDVNGNHFQRAMLAYNLNCWLMAVQPGSQYGGRHAASHDTGDGAVAISVRGGEAVESRG